MSFFYFVDRKIGGLSSAHSYMFHGICERPGAKYPSLPCRYGDKIKHPLYVTRNIFNNPEVYSPYYSDLVVSESIKERLSFVRNIEFLQVRYKKLFNDQYDKKTTRYPKIDDIDLMDKYENDLELASNLPSYYEVIVPLLSSVNKKFMNTIEVNLSTFSDEIPNAKIQVSNEIFDSYPILEGYGILMHKDIFNIFENYLDNDYFLVVKIPY